MLEGDNWGLPDLEYDAWTCLKLTMEVVLLDAGRFFSRKRLSFLSRGTTYLPAEAPNLDELAFLPVAAGLWRQHELWDGTYTLDDLLDIAELIQVTRENEIRSRESEV